MKLLINYKYLSLLLLLVAFSACEKDEDLTLIEASHRVVFTSEMDFENKIQLGGEIALGDVSSGVVSRTWTFPDGVADILGSDNDVTSEEANVKAVFNVVGEHTVRLQQTFDRPAYVGTTQQGTSLDTSIVITVLDFVSASIQAHYINEDGSTGEPLDISEGAENEVTASRSVRFSYTATGGPEHFLWQFEGGDPGTFETAAEQIDIKYKKQGTYDVHFIASRERPFGGDTISLKNFIKVVPSTDPVTLDGVTDKDGKIALVFSREMDGSTLAADNFSVAISNKGNVLNPAISRASIDSEEGNIVLLELDNETLYNDDTVRVSYTPGTLSTLDGVAATAFTDAQLTFTKVNILKESSSFDFSFENSSETNWPYLWWGDIWGEYDLSISSARAKTGSQSAYVEFRPFGGMIIGHRDLNGNDLTFPVEKGKDYEIGVWVYVEDLGNNSLGANLPNIRFYWGPDTNWGVGSNPDFTSDYKVGEWVYSRIFVQFDSSGDKNFMIRGYNEFNAEKLKFYMDDISVSEVILRP